MQFQLDDKNYENNLEFNQYLDNEYGDVEIAQNTYFTSKALFATDIDAYNSYFQDYLANYPSEILDKVKDTFPTQIAYTFKQFWSNSENNNQKLTLLRDTTEITLYTVFAIIISKLANDGMDFKSIPGVKNYNGRIMTWKIGSKIEVLDKILDWYNLESSYNVDFIDKILTKDIIQLFNDLNELRNKFSHQITLTEKESGEWLEKFSPLLYDLLDKLNYLENFKFCNYSNAKDLENHVINKFIGYSRDFDKEDINIEAQYLPNFIEILKKRAFFYVIDDEYILVTPFLYYKENGREHEVCFYKKTETDGLHFGIIGKAEEYIFQESDFVNQITLLKSLSE